MTTEISAHSISISGVARRSIPILHRFHSTLTNVASGGGFLVQFDSQNMSQSKSTTGFTYNNGVFTNTSGNDLVVLASYGILWNGNFDNSRMSWIQLSNGTERYGMVNQQSVSIEPAQTGSAVIVVPNNGFLRLWVFHQSGSNKTLVANYGMPYFNICVI